MGNRLSLYELQLCRSLFTRSFSTSIGWTLSPRQRDLERAANIEDAPADDNVVVEANKTENLKAKVCAAKLTELEGWNSSGLPTEGKSVWGWASPTGWKPRSRPV